jgi:glutamate-5-semialdehyde dehydrogenase
MTAPLKSIEGTGDQSKAVALANAMGGIGRAARAAARVLALAAPEQKDRALDLMAAAVRTQKARILAANAEDLAEARSADLSNAAIDRLALDDKRVEGIAAAIETVRALKDPVGVVTESWTRPNGMTIERVRVPLGVIGIIYEPPERDGRRRRAVPEIRQRRDPARRLGLRPLEPRHPCCTHARPAGRRTARGLHPAGADA